MNEGQGRILIVDDEPNALRVLSSILKGWGCQVLEARDGDGALALLPEDPDAVITDLRMPGRDGRALLEHMTENAPDIPVIFLTAYGTVESAVQTISEGAFYYFIKPPDYRKLQIILRRAVEQRRLKRELARLRQQVLSDADRYRIIGQTPQMRRVYETIEAVKDSATSVLVTGETGTGKEVVARNLHGQSTRRELPFVAVNCAAIPKELMESELFGYEKGAFTGALSSRKGKVEEVAGGTLFLDEIAELELSLQAKLLRVLQEREFERLGSNRKVRADFRLVSSTNQDLRREVQAGRFREDLYYRINVIEVKLSPLRERMDDLPLLLETFVKEFCAAENKILTVSEGAMRILLGYHWPGNVRQLKNVVERAVVLARTDKITPRELPEELRTSVRRVSRTDEIPLGTLKDLELAAVRNALAAAKGNKSKAAKILGISRKSFYHKLRSLSDRNGNTPI